MIKIATLVFLMASLAQPSKITYDVIIRGGTVYDGSGNVGIVTDIGIVADTIALIGDLSDEKGKKEIDAKGLAVAPGFINMLSHAEFSILLDGNAQSDIRQGVTLEVMGEISMGPLNEPMKQNLEESFKNYYGIDYKVNWNTLGEYFENLEKKGMSLNLASFVGVGIIRENIMGHVNRNPTVEELEKMKLLVKQAMEEGAMGLTTALIYAPDNYTNTEELIELSKIASSYGGIYTVHMRSEGNAMLDAINETIRIAKEAKIPAEIYHLKFSGKNNWNKFDTVISMIQNANQSGLKITANMYTYTAGATGLDAAMPPWLQEGGIEEWIKRMKDPIIREKALKEMRSQTNEWENLMRLADNPVNILLLGFAKDSLQKKFGGKTLAEVARIHGKTPEETVMDLVIADYTRVETAYFLMTEENVKKQIALPYISFGSDADAPSMDKIFQKSLPHPRTYGNFARLLGKYVRDEKVIPLEEAIRKLTSLPAINLKIAGRGWIKRGYFADISIFNPLKIQDHSTFEKPFQYSTGMVHVFVNGIQVLENGEHTNAKPGRIIRGSGWNGK